MNVQAIRTDKGYKIVLADGAEREWRGKRALAATHVACLAGDEFIHSSSKSAEAAEKNLKGYGFTGQILTLKIN